jgi:hypothetical protein
MGSSGEVNGGRAVGEHQITARTIDAVRYLRGLRSRNLSVKIDVEGSEVRAT